MKNYIQRWKSLDKNGLKLSFICGLNWLVRFVVKSQLYFFLGVLLVLMTHYMPRSFQQMTVYVFIILLLTKCLENLFHLVLSSEFTQLRSVFQSVTALLFFVEGTGSIYQDHLSELELNRLLFLCLINLIVGRLVAILQPRLFENYLFKKVIHKEYLGIRKTAGDLPPESDFYVDVEERDADKRMRVINQNVIKSDYQDFVELSFLEKVVVTGIGRKVKSTERAFQEIDVLYYPVFRVYPFGMAKPGYTLITFKIRRK